MNKIKEKIIKFFLKIFFALDNFCYKAISSLAIKYEGGIHPKHRILNYHQFFLDNIEKNNNVLDLGCGNGNLTLDLSFKAQKVVGIDLNEKYLAVARKKNQAQNVEYILGDATIHSFNNKFDVVVLSNVLEHIENREEFLKKIKLIAQKILIRVPMLSRDWLSVYKKEMGTPYRLDKTHFIEYTKEQFIEEIEKSGLKIQKMEINFGEIYAVLQ
jgi:ubiquinone/menaquinone biosynthesis C-methylase UbiE